MDASAVGAARLAGELLPGGTGFLAGVPAALAVGVGGVRHRSAVGIVKSIQVNNSSHQS
jgi:hypothetical protein